MAQLDIVGAGVLGLTLGYNLIRRGVAVRIWQHGGDLGGMLAPARLPGLGDREVDRFAHAIRPSDHNLLALIDELGLSDDLRSAVTINSCYHHGRIHPLPALRDLLDLPDLGLADRVRLALAIVATRHTRGWQSLERATALAWLRSMGGLGALDWKHLLRARFDTRFDTVPATYVWSRLLGAANTHDQINAPDTLSYLRGGNSMLIAALSRVILAHGGMIVRNAAVEQLRIDKSCVTGLRLAEGDVASDGAVLALPTPLARRLLPPEATTLAARWDRHKEYLGLVSVLLALHRPLTPAYALHITDDHIPFSAVVETTNLIDRAYTGGYHLVYLPKYVTPGSPYARMDDATIQQLFRVYLQQMFPDLTEDAIAAIHVEREHYVEPIHLVGKADTILSIDTDVAGLYLVNSAQVYPLLASSEAAVAHVTRASERIVRSLASLQPPLAQCAAA
ncbi:MAG TPA: FAD-dependent oxidoreductase [Roseiflexaceae bacterium]|nr:FAD-dependent oxidoreductase [Roseiflexaceae bacterium]